MSLQFGNLTQEFVNFNNAVQNITPDGPQSPTKINEAARHFRHVAANDASYLTYIGATFSHLGMGMFIFTYMNVWVYTSEATAKRIRERFLRAILRQDITFFDKVGAGEVTTRIQTDTHLVQQGLSEKVPLMVGFFSAFVTGFVLAWTHELCTLAEEIVSTIRTTQAFGTQRMLASLCDVATQNAYNADCRGALVQAMGLSGFFFAMYAAYALAFSFGITLIIVINEGHATPGEIMNVFMSVIIGSLSLALMVPELQAVTNGRASTARLLIWFLLLIPPVKRALKPSTVVGEIAVENVDFNYPARSETTALVGASGSGKSTIVSLVERFYDPLCGSVRLDGINIRELNVKWLRSQIGTMN
ncbi:ABC transporter type 1, transmembrane domain-containing protein [Russula aff. rugulosa BPL654]|nr:ABC transporter type 1, transmembrane domain-containing protein [Russula aff. rugulosa BPL654]